MNSYPVYQSWLEEHNIDPFEFMDVLAGNGYSTDPAGFDADGKAYWVITDYKDTNNNTFPDFLEELFGIGVVTNPTQGGMGG